MAISLQLCKQLGVLIAPSSEVGRTSYGYLLSWNLDRHSTDGVEVARRKALSTKRDDL